MAPYKRIDWSPKKRAIAVTLRREGYSFRQIAQKMGGGVTFSGVRKVYKRYLENGTVKNRPGRGRKLQTTPQTDRRIVRMSLKDRRLTAVEINKCLAADGMRVSQWTVRRRLLRAGLKARKPQKKPLLNVDQRRKRLRWAQDHLHWSVHNWNQVIWSDETKISIFGSDGVKYVRRRPGEAFRPDCMIATMKQPVSVMIWGCMSRSSVGRIAVLDGIINADRYIREVLETKLLQSAKDMFGDGGNFIFQQDGAPCHTAKKSMQWFRDNGVEVLSWPGNSPDLNPIENLWARLKKLVSAIRPSNRQQLIEATINCWYRVISPAELEKLVDSMPRRCAAVVNSRGYPTKY